MNLDSVKTPRDLEALNNQRSEADEIVDAVLEAGIIVGHEVTIRLINAAIDFHKKMVAEKATSDDLDAMDIILWTRDLTRLEDANDLLATIDLGE